MNSSRSIKKTSVIAAFVVPALLFAALHFVSAEPWRERSGHPPLNDSPQFLTTASSLQEKTGVLTVGGLRVTNGKLLIPFGKSVPTDSGFLNDTAIWVGTRIQATDFCLTSNITTCLGNVPVRIATPKMIISGSAILPAGTSLACHPFESSTCGTIGDPTLGMQVPFSVSLSAIRASLGTALSPSATYSCIMRVQVANGGCDGVFSDTALVTHCSPGSSKECDNSSIPGPSPVVTVPAGSCMRLRVYSHNLNDTATPLSDNGLNSCGGRSITWSLIGE